MPPTGKTDSPRVVGIVELCVGRKKVDYDGHDARGPSAVRNAESIGTKGTVVWS